MNEEMEIISLLREVRKREKFEYRFNSPPISSMLAGCRRLTPKEFVVIAEKLNHCIIERFVYAYKPDHRVEYMWIMYHEKPFSEQIYIKLICELGSETSAELSLF